METLCLLWLRTDSPMSMQILAHKRKALALKREGNMTEAKEELKKAKILERQVEEMALVGQGEGEDEASDDDELAALIRGLEKEEKTNSHPSQRVASHALPDDFSLPNFGDDDDDSNVEVQVIHFGFTLFLCCGSTHRIECGLVIEYLKFNQSHQ